MFTLEFKTGNAAFSNNTFEDPGIFMESKRILEHIASKIGDGQKSGIVADYNGNSIGAWCLKVPGLDEDE